MFVMLETSQPESIRCRCPDTTGANASTSRSVRTAAAVSESRFCACGWDLTISAFSSVRGGAPDTLPLGLLQLQCGVAHQQMPDHGLERFGMRRHRVGIDGRDNADYDAHLGGIPAVASDYPKHPGARRLGVLERAHKIGADVLFETPTPD